MDLQTRLEYSEHFIPFVDEFKEYIRHKRIAIEGEDLYQVAIDENPKN